MAVSLSSSSPIVIFGAGYVGMSLGVLLSQEHHVLVIDTDPSKVTKINNNKGKTKKKARILSFLSAFRRLFLRGTPSVVYNCSEVEIALSY